MATVYQVLANSLGRACPKKDKQASRHAQDYQQWRLPKDETILRWARVGEGQGQQLRQLSRFRVQEENGGVLS